MLLGVALSFHYCNLLKLIESGLLILDLNFNILSPVELSLKFNVNLTVLSYFKRNGLFEIISLLFSNIKCILDALAHKEPWGPTEVTELFLWALLT